MPSFARTARALAILAALVCALDARAQGRVGPAPSTRATDPPRTPDAPDQSSPLIAVALLGSEGAARVVGLSDVAWSSEGLTARVAGADRRARIAFQDSRAILFAGAWQPWASAPALAQAMRGFDATLLLRNGERLTGRLIGGSDDGLIWESPILGRLEAPLDSVAMIVRAEGDGPPPALEIRPAPPAPPVDEVALINGDRLVGRVSFDDDTLLVRRGGDLTRLPIDRIGEIRFAALPPVERGGRLTIWLADGTVLHADAIEPQRLADATALQLVTDHTGRIVRVPAGIVAAISSSPDPLLSFAELEPREQATLGADGHSRVETVEPSSRSGLAALGARDLVFAGPSRTEWDLPAQARLLMGRAILPEEGWAFAEARLTIWLDKAPAFQTTLSKTLPETFFAIPLKGGEEAIVTLQAGGAGEAQAVAVLRQPMLLVAEDEP